MKNFIFAFIATVMLSGMSFGQQQTHPTKEQVETGLVEGMAEFIKNLGTFYKNGQSYEQFKAELYKNKNVPSTMPKEGEALLKKAYSYLTKGGVTKEQIKKDGIEEYANAVYFIINCKTRDAEASLFGISDSSDFSDSSIVGKSGCKWYQINCWMTNIFGDNWVDIVITVICFFANC